MPIPTRRLRRRLSQEAIALAMKLGVIVALALTFAIIGDTVVEDGRLRFDRWAALFVHRQFGADWSRPMHWVTDIASGPVVVPIILALLGVLLVQRRRIEAAVVAVAWIGGQLLYVVLKLLYQRPRPDLFPPLAHAGGYSFPSGHAVTAVVTYGLIAAIVSPRLPSGWRWLPAMIAAAIVLIVATSRVYLGVHYPTDVIGSMLIGAAWLRSSLLALSHLKRSRKATSAAIK